MSSRFGWVARSRSAAAFARRRIRYRRDPEVRRHTAVVRRGMQLPAVPRSRRVAGSVWAVSMVKNEADVIENVIRHLFDQGVSAVLVADNGSTDQTPEILRRLASEYPLHIAQDVEPAYYQQHKMSLLADAARRAGADWIVPFDADEYWFAPEGKLAEWLRAQRADVVSARIYNVFPAADPASRWVMDLTAHMNPKVAFRSFRGAQLTVGNHRVSRPGLQVDGLLIAHQPWRSFEQFERKLRDGARALSLADMHGSQGAHWRDGAARDTDELRTLWAALIAGLDNPELGWSPTGTLVDVGNDPSHWRPRPIGQPAHRPAAMHLEYALPDGRDDWDRATTVARELAHALGAVLDVVPAAPRPLRHRVRRALSHQPPARVVLAPRVEDLARVLAQPSRHYRYAWIMSDTGVCPALPPGRIERLIVPTDELAQQVAQASTEPPVVVAWRTDTSGLRCPAVRATDVLVVAPAPGVERVLDELHEPLVVRHYVASLPTVYERDRAIRAAILASKCVIASSPWVRSFARDLGADVLDPRDCKPADLLSAIASWAAGQQRGIAAPEAGHSMVQQIVDIINAPH